MYCYSLFGFSVWCDIYLPELPAHFLNDCKNPDIQIKTGTQKPAQTENHKPFQVVCLKEAPARFKLIWNRIGCYTVDESGLILAEPEPSCNIQIFRQSIYGVVFALFLLTKKFLVLHGTSVTINGVTLTIIGNEGEGKSTLSAHLLARGHKLVSDDISAIDFSPKRLAVLPGCSVLRLWDNYIPDIIATTARYAYLINKKGKKAYFLDTIIEPSATILGGLIILEQGKKLDYELLTGQKKLIHITTGNYFSRIINTLPIPFQKQILTQSGQLASQTPAWTLKRPHDLKKLDLTAEIIEKLALN